MQWLVHNPTPFPDYSEINSEGIIALSESLSVDRLQEAYSKGIFPWYNKNEPVVWWCPNPRFVLFPEELIISHSMRSFLKKNLYTISYNTCFQEVMQHCRLQNRKDQNSTWIQEEMVEAYTQLHQKGWAKSVEVWNRDNKLVGGLYGVEVHRVFCGESMFSLESNASKTALIHLIQNGNYALIDCQVYTHHLKSLGARNISREAFLDYLKQP